MITEDRVVQLNKARELAGEALIDVERALCPKALEFHHKACGWCRHDIPRAECEMCTMRYSREQTHYYYYEDRK